jgi:heme oxygenase
MTTDMDTYSFTKRLKEETKVNHKILDTHYFVKSIFSNGAVNEEKSDYTATTGYYLDLHLLMLNEIQLILKESLYQFPEYFKEFNKDYNKQQEVNNDIINYKSVISLINKLHSDSRNKELLLSHMYIWWLGVLYGGQMIKRSITKRNPHLLDYTNLIFNFNCNTKTFIFDFKEYLENSINNQDHFIDNVNEVYLLIQDVFDELTNK